MKQIRKPKQAAPPKPTHRFTLRDFIVPVFLLAAILIAYFPALDGLLLWDDEGATIENPLMWRPGGLWTMWTTIGRIPGEEHFWPLTYTVLWLQFQLWKGWPVGYHFTNFLLHAAICIQLWRLMRRIELPGAAIAAALFAVHPVHVESVAWIISLKDLLATLFYLFAVEFFINYAERHRAIWLIAAVFAAAAAMLSKSMTLTLPFGLAILLWYRNGRIARREWIGLIAIGALVFSMALADTFVVRQFGSPIANVPSLPRRLIHSGRAFWFYLEKLCWPVGLSTIYPQWKSNIARAADWLPLLAAAFVAIALWLPRRRIGRGPLACWLFFGVSLAPVLGIVYFYFLHISPVADRYQYLPSLGPIVGFGALAGVLLKKIPFRRRAVLYVPIFAILFLFAGLTRRQSAHYRDIETLFTHSMLYAPQSPENHYELGNGLLQHDKNAEAEKHFREALRLRPDYLEAINGIGDAYFNMKRDAECVATHREAMAKGLTIPNVLNRLARILATTADRKLRNPAEALQYANQSVSMRRDAKSLCALAMAQAACGNPALAAETVHEALQLATDAGDRDSFEMLNIILPVFQSGQAVIDY